MSAEDVVLGQFKLTKSENFEEFMKELGLNIVVRKLANASSPTITVSRTEDGTYTLKTKTLIKSSSIAFKLNEEFDEVRQDDVKVKSVITREGNTLHHKMVSADGNEVKILREFRPDCVYTEATINGIKSIRTYGRLAEK